MDFNRHPNNSGFDGEADFDYQGGVDHEGCPVSSVPDSQHIFPHDFDAAESPNGYQEQNSGQQPPHGIAHHVQVQSDQANTYNQSPRDPHHAQHHFNAHGAMDDMPIADHMDPRYTNPESSAYRNSMPHGLLHVQKAFNAYVASYNDDSVSQNVRMQIAKALALELLQHYYPAYEGYFVEESSLGPMAKYGMNFMCKAPDGTDPDYKFLKPLPPYVWKDPKKGKDKAKRPSGKHMAARMKENSDREYARQFASYWPFTTGVSWRQIEPEDITGFKVFKEHTIISDGIETVELNLHTCLAIVLAPPDLLSHIAETNDVHRGDILTDVLSQSQQIRRGHCILLFGNWLELYDFDNGAETIVFGNVDGEHYESKITYEEPHVTISRSPDEQPLALDLRTTGLGVVDEVCQMVVRKEVLRLEEFSPDVKEIGSGTALNGVVNQQLSTAGPIASAGAKVTDATFIANGAVPAATEDEKHSAILQEQVQPFVDATPDAAVKHEMPLAHPASTL